MTDLAKTLIEKLQVNPGGKARLRDRDPRDKSLFGDEQQTKASTASLAKEIDALQDRLYAEGSRALLVILQLWLLTATMNAYMGGDHSPVWPAAVASLGCLLVNLWLLRRLVYLQRAES